MAAFQSAGPPDGDSAFWPETKTEVLQRASAGDWSAFLRHYLQPCCREISSRLRYRGRAPLDAEDLFQELIVRLMRPSSFSAKLQEIFAKHGLSRVGPSTLPQRYLQFRELPLQSMRFRQFLKGTIRNVTREALRRRDLHHASGVEIEAVEPWIEESISTSLDRRWMIDCLSEAAEQLRRESNAARTAGPRSYFRVLYLAFVHGKSTQEIADSMGRHRAVAGRRWREARTRYIELLHEYSGIEDETELREMLRGVPGALREAFVAVVESPLP